jgi:hypothetical protein
MQLGMPESDVARRYGTARELVIVSLDSAACRSAARMDWGGAAIAIRRYVRRRCAEQAPMPRITFRPWPGIHGPHFSKQECTELAGVSPDGNNKPSKQFVEQPP